MQSNKPKFSVFSLFPPSFRPLLRAGALVLSALSVGAAVTAVTAVTTTPALAQAQPGSLGVVRWPGADLYVDANSSSGKLASVGRGEKVAFVKHDALWSKVRWQDQGELREGWMSRIFIDWRADPAVTPATSRQAAAANAPPVNISDAPGKPRGRAVLFGISSYQPDQAIPTLPGVPRDMHSASVMAQLMGITPDRITIHRDGAASKASMIATLNQLAKDVAADAETRTATETPADEPVLVYYSGHGGRIADAETPQRCIEGLIAHDGQLLTNTEMADLLRPLSKVTDGLFVFFDSCHSGGLSATRAVGAVNAQRLKPKFVARGDLSNCSEIVNMLKPPAAGTSGTRRTGKPYVYAAAARADEVSLDDPEQGGLATSNFLRCMIEGNGKQSVEAIRACAQKGIDETVAGNSTFKSPHLSITGDLNTVPVQVTLNAARRKQLLATASQAPLGNRPAGSKAVEFGGKNWPPVNNPGQAFAAIAARTDAASPLVVTAPGTLKIDSEALQLQVKAPANGYLYLFQAAADGKSAVLLFPNLVDHDHRVRQNQSVSLPRAAWPLVAGGPEGESQLLVVFSRTERDIARLIGEESGPFLELAVSPAGMQALALAISRSAHAESAECRRSAKTKGQCDPRYSATLKIIRESR